MALVEERRDPQRKPQPVAPHVLVLLGVPLDTPREHLLERLPRDRNVGRQKLLEPPETLAERAPQAPQLRLRRLLDGESLKLPLFPGDFGVKRRDALDDRLRPLAVGEGGQQVIALRERLSKFGLQPFRAVGLRAPMLVKWPGHIKPNSVSNGIQSHEDLFVTLAAAAGMPGLKDELLTGKRMGDATYKVHLDGYNNLPLWTGATDKSARREFFYYDETDLMAVRVDGWKLHIGVKHKGSWFDEKSYPSVPYVVNLLMDPMEKMTPDSEEFAYIGQKFFAHKMWAGTGAVPFLAAHLKSLGDYPPSQGADTLSMKAVIDKVMKKLESPTAGSR